MMTEYTQASAPDPGMMRIKASPSKNFFIHMLTRDVQLSRAIIDLLDNSVDGAKRLRGDGRFDGLWVQIEVSAEHFKISDNCGGIPIDIAKDYAFCFGRPEGAVDTPGSMGLFGVGMKRTFFKLGNVFDVKSRCSTEEFDMKVNVNEWLSIAEDDPNDWHFQFTRVLTGIEEIRGRESGTDIIVTELHRAIVEMFALDNFHSELTNDINAAHMLSIQRGLGITVNRMPVDLIKPTLFQSDQIQPAVREFEISRKQLDGKDGDGVHVRLLAGLSKRSLADGGWSLFCNGRLIMKSDKTAASIWGSSHNLRQYHPNFAYFRGYAFVDSQNSILLPWTTTKTGVDIDSAVYRTVQQEMIEISKPIIAFLIRVAKEQQNGVSDPSVLDKALGQATSVEFNAFNGIVPFKADLQTVPPGPKLVNIQYQKSQEEVEKVKTKLGVRSATEAGRRTFEYFLEYEGDE
jgi:hypothetical protein